MAKIGILIGVIVCLMACSDETRENPPLKGDYFLRGNPWKFYFLDEQGKSAIQLKAGAVLPTAGLEIPDEPEIVPDGYVPDDGEYSYGMNSVGYDEEKKLYYWTTYVPGNNWVTESRFYVRFDRKDVDTLRVHFKFITEGVDGGNGIVADIRELYYNGLLVIKNDEYASEEGILIQKN